MPIAGFTTLDGERIKLSDIDVIKDAHRFNASPATLATLIDSAQARTGVGFSASQLGKTMRQHVLEAGDYYPATGKAMSGHLGTLKHAAVNVKRPGMIVEERFKSKRNPRLSGQIDHAAIIELTDDGTLVVDLYDLKTVGWYSVVLMVKDVWANKPDYAWQLNLCATMMEECYADDFEDFACDGIAFDIGPHSYVWDATKRIRVRNLYLECIPSDGSYKHEDEANRLGLPEYEKVIIPVSRKSADEVYAVYEEALAQRDAALAAGYAPICEDTWFQYKKQMHLRCVKYCAVLAECRAMADAHNEAHPLDTEEQLLEKSIKRGQVA
jgi:hypothetical protein